VVLQMRTAPKPGMISLRRWLRGGLLIATCFVGSCASDPLLKAPPGLRDRLVLGRSLYERHCMACHQAGAEGDQIKVVPSLAAQNAAYLRQQLARFASGERRSSDMDMHWALQHFDFSRQDDLDAISAYLAQLDPDRFPGTGNAGDVAVGQGIYQAKCAACHGTDAAGSPGTLVPRLRAQHYSYLCKRLRNLAGHESSGTANSAGSSAPLTDSQINAVSSYLSRL
jgi:cytochrome c553